MTVKPETHKLDVVWWILESDSNFREQMLRDWMNNKLLAVEFVCDTLTRQSKGFALYKYTHDNFCFVVYLQLRNKGELQKYREALEAFAKHEYPNLKGFRFQTRRNPKLWERLWPGFKKTYTILEKGIK